MDGRDQLIASIQQAAAQKILSREDVIAAYDRGVGIERTSSDSSPARVSIAQILYAVGGLVVVMGIFTMVWQSWDFLGSLVRILVSLGSGIVAYVVGALLHRAKRYDGVSQAFFLISGAVMPTGLAVALYEAGVEVTSYAWQSVVSLLVCAMFAASLLIFRKVVFAIYTTAFATWLFFAVTSLLVSGQPQFITWDFSGYRWLIVGLAYILVGAGLRQYNSNYLMQWYYGLGIFTFLGAALMLGGWEPNQRIIWELVFPLLCFAALFLSVYLKSRAFLIFGALYLILFIMKITGEYFSDTFGWPLALVVSGLSLIGIGYGAVYLNKNYLAKTFSQTESTPTSS